jgi:hypothetical protein
VRLIGQDRDRGAAKTAVANDPADPFEMGNLTLEQRDLDAIVAGGLEALEQRKMRFGDVCRPQQEVEPRPHAPAPLPARCLDLGRGRHDRRLPTL